MSKTNRPNYRRADREDRSHRHHRQDRRIVVRGVRRDPPDLRKLSRAVIALAMAEMDAEQQVSPESVEAAAVTEDGASERDVRQEREAETPEKLRKEVPHDDR
ncbi:hypothetical protein [Mycobacteroides abscessus]|uniref:hypothetical protein n=1 Tax=Mycobacteroides abscessus TaxID=36809 RepID=UPI000E67C9D5|nr:hypothetical protein [Mycobacteroides abscessus]RIS58106.1 hypothetical protein D2E46_01400 [Mycobacteroides abscessus]